MTVAGGGVQRRLAGHCRIHIRHVVGNQVIDGNQVARSGGGVQGVFGVAIPRRGRPVRADIRRGAIAPVGPRVPNRRRGASRNRDACIRRRIVKLLRAKPPRANGRAQSAIPGGQACVIWRASQTGWRVKRRRSQSPATVRAGGDANSRRGRPVHSDIRRGTVASVRVRIERRRKIANRRNFACAIVGNHVRRTNAGRGIPRRIDDKSVQAGVAVTPPQQYQRPDNGGMVPVGGIVQRRFAGVVCRIHIRARRHQHRDNVVTTASGRPVQRRLAGAVCQSHIRARRDQRHDTVVKIRAFGRPVQRR